MFTDLSTIARNGTANTSISGAYYRTSRGELAKFAMHALISRMDSGLFNADDIAAQAEKYADAMIARGLG